MPKKKEERNFTQAEKASLWAKVQTVLGDPSFSYFVQQKEDGNHYNKGSWLNPEKLTEYVQSLHPQFKGEKRLVYFISDIAKRSSSFFDFQINIMAICKDHPAGNVNLIGHIKPSAANEERVKRDHRRQALDLALAARSQALISYSETDGNYKIQIAVKKYVFWPLMMLDPDFMKVPFIVEKESEISKSLSGFPWYKPGEFTIVNLLGIKDDIENLVDFWLKQCSISLNLLYEAKQAEVRATATVLEKGFDFSDLSSAKYGFDRLLGVFSKSVKYSNFIIATSSYDSPIPKISEVHGKNMSETCTLPPALMIAKELRAIKKRAGKPKAVSLNDIDKNSTITKTKEKKARITVSILEAMGEEGIRNFALKFLGFNVPEKIDQATLNAIVQSFNNGEK